VGIDVISAHAKESVEHIFFRAIRSRLTMEASDVCEIVPADAHGAHSLSDGNLVILTISGIAFRLLLILQYDEDERTQSYFLREESERAFLEVFLEICNLCCGAVNQELLQYFPDLGMSTPYVLSARCRPYLEALKPEFLASYAVSINDAVRLGATICMCAHAPIDFVAEASALEDTSGELELF
jgi:hypothetical protein